MNTKKLALWLAGAFLLACTACKQTATSDITVYIPDGAPALAMAKLLCEDTETDGVRYYVVSSSGNIATKVTYQDMSKNADICVLPITAAAKFLGTGKKYRMLGTVTRGNLYILGKENTELTKDGLSALLGTTVGVIKLGDVPGLTFKAILSKLGVPWQELKDGVTRRDDAVNLQAIAGASTIDKTADVQYWVAGEPAVSLQVGKGLYRVGDLQALYGDGYTQAVLVAKNTLIDNKNEWLQGFLTDVQKGLEWVLNTDAVTLVSAINAHMEDKASATDLKAPLLTNEALVHCGIEFRSSASCIAETQAFLQDLYAVSDYNVLPSTTFYYGAI